MVSSAYKKLIIYFMAFRLISSSLLTAQMMLPVNFPFIKIEEERWKETEVKAL